MRRIVAMLALCATLTAGVVVTAPDAGATTVERNDRAAAIALAVAGPGSCGGSATSTAGPQQAVDRSVANARSHGVTQAITVLDRSTGTQLASTSNANSQIASESIMKLLLAAYYLVLYGGYPSTPASVKNQLSYMLRYSDDATASALFTANAIPTIAARYGLGHTTNATDRAGHWGAARITSRDMAVFLYRASKDAAVGPWLIPVMAQTNATGSDGFNQKFGLNALTGTHGSKQGWGADSYWTSQPYAIHSVGYTSGYFVAVLQLGPAGTYADPMRGLATSGAQWIQAARTSSATAAGVSTSGAAGVGSLQLSTATAATISAAGVTAPAAAATAAAASSSVAGIADGTFIRMAGSTEVYRVAGGAPVYVSSRAIFGNPAVRTVTSAQFHALRLFPAEGTYLRAAPGAAIYRVAGGSAVYVSSMAELGATRAQAIAIDANAISKAGTSVRYRHLRAAPADGTFLRSAGDNHVYRVAGNAPVYVSSWAAVGGTHAAVTVDARAISNAGSGRWTNLSQRPKDGSFLRAYSTGQVFRMAGGAPIYLQSWASAGLTAQPTVTVDARAIANGGSSGVWSHVLYCPRNGTFLRGHPGNRVYVVTAGVPRYVPSWAPYGGAKPTVTVSQATINRAGGSAPYDHLR